jgi:hypothetical protein
MPLNLNPLEGGLSSNFGQCVDICAHFAARTQCVHVDGEDSCQSDRGSQCGKERLARLVTGGLKGGGNVRHSATW